MLAGVTGAPFTVTLPLPSPNAIVGVIAGASATGANPITVARHSTDVISGVGLSGATSLLLGTPGAFAILKSDGANWFVVAGQQDTGWQALTLSSSPSVTVAVGLYVPSARLQGDTVRLSGTMRNNSGGTSHGAADNTGQRLPLTAFAGQLSSPSIVYGVNDLSVTVFTGSVSTSGQISFGASIATTRQIALDNAIYRLV